MASLFGKLKRAVAADHEEQAPVPAPPKKQKTETKPKPAGGQGRRLGDWDCPVCGDALATRHPAWCRRCGTPRPWDDGGSSAVRDREFYEFSEAYYDDLELYFAGLSDDMAEIERARLLPDS